MSADTDNDNVGLIVVLLRLAIVMVHREVQRFDPGEVIRIEDVLRAHPPPRRRTKDTTGMSR